MAKKHKQEWTGTILTYGIEGVGDAMLDINDLNDEVKTKAMQFAFQTLARNATAGLMSTADDMKTALERVVARFKNFTEGVWRSGGGAESAERPTSMLARAFAEAVGVEPSEAAARIANIIDTKVQEAGLSSDEEDDKAGIREIASEVRKFIASTKEVAPILLRIKAEEAAKRAQMGTKEDAPSLGALGKAVQR